MSKSCAFELYMTVLFLDNLVYFGSDAGAYRDASDTTGHGSDAEAKHASDGSADASEDEA